MIDRFDRLLMYLRREQKKWNIERQKFIDKMFDELLEFVDIEQENAYYDMFKIK